jgi:hypothetical protein
MYEVAEAHRCHRSSYRQYCEHGEQQDNPFVLAIPEFHRRIGWAVLLPFVI